MAVDVAQRESNNIKRYASECNRITFNNQRELKKKKEKKKKKQQQQQQQQFKRQN